MISKEEALKGIGLSEKEIKVYLALLVLGQSSVNAIAKKSNINRVTCYDLLKVLSEKGFVSYVIRSGVKYFEAVNPSKFIDDLKEKQEKIQTILPELQQIKGSIIEKLNMETYEGINGLKSIFNDILKENKQTDFIGAPRMLKSLEFYFPHFIKQKRKQNIFSRVITEDCKEMFDYKKKSPKKYIKMKFIKNNINITKIIYGNKVAFLTFNKENSIGILIQDKELAEQERQLFNMLYSKII